MTRMRLLVLHGPNLDRLGSREPGIYGTMTLAEIDASLGSVLPAPDHEVVCRQSSYSGQLVDWVNGARDEGFHGIVVNPGALTHYDLALRDALAAAGLPIIEVHLTNIHAREPFRARSVTGAAVRGVISGLGWRGYAAALRFLADEIGGSVGAAP